LDRKNKKYWPVFREIRKGQCTRERCREKKSGTSGVGGRGGFMDNMAIDKLREGRKGVCGRKKG